MSAVESRERAAVAPGPSGPSNGATPGSATLSISEAAALLGVGRNLAYEVASRDGELAGVPVIRIGRRLLVPHARLLAVLGLDDSTPVAKHGGKHDHD